MHLPLNHPTEMFVTSGTDGIDVTNISLGSAFPQGVFVAQDDVNDSGNQNFKLVPWHVIATGVGLQEPDSTHHPPQLTLPQQQ